MKDVAAASKLLKPCDARLMRCYPISTRISHVANDDEACSAPVELAVLTATSEEVCAMYGRYISWVRRRLDSERFEAGNNSISSFHNRAH